MGPRHVPVTDFTMSSDQLIYLQPVQTQCEWYIKSRNIW